jgi:hypothetical protein
LRSSAFTHQDTDWRTDKFCLLRCMSPEAADFVAKVELNDAENLAKADF